ncbi:MAG TPA: FAD-binding protein [Pseudonocardiaceae bacterium]|nr:FAD-binding protein [Pseudonocardiaceae bacterium]
MSTRAATPTAREVAVPAGDPRFAELAARGHNQRFAGTPDRLWLPRSTEQVETVLRQAVETVGAGGRIAARSGGHCLEDFVDNPRVRGLVDLSGMTKVRFDPAHRAFAVDAGARLGEVYRRLYLNWGVALPAGENAGVGAGGHVSGGGHGVLCRSHGLVVDHLYAVEVVGVDASGEVRAVVATREHDDPNRELWWAHTGGGGGNFGIATRFWFRTPGGDASDPATLLPAPPDPVLRFRAEWPWAGLTGDGFARLVRNHGAFFERHADPGSPYAGLYDELYLQRKELGTIFLIGQLAGGPDAERLLAAHLAELSDGVGVAPTVTRSATVPWVTAAVRGLSDEPGVRWRMKIKSGYLRRCFTDRQIAALHRHLTRADPGLAAGMVTLMSYGGAVNTVNSAETAMAQRDSILKLSYLAAWFTADQDAAHLAWLRDLYADVYADTGGVPAPGEVNDGCYINYPDADLADPAWNTSGIPWHRLYYKDGYTRLRRVKARWDPLGVFGHRLSVQA